MGDVQRLYTRRARAYIAYVSAFRHRQGLRAVLESSAAVGSGQRILDAGCGTGLSIFALHEALGRRGSSYRSIDAFDLTPAMLERCRSDLDRAGVARVELRQADVLHLDDQLPRSWSGYDLVLCASMLEYVPRPQLSAGLAALRTRLAPGGRLVLFIMRKAMFFTRWIWQCEGYSRLELAAALREAGFSGVVHRRYPWSYAWLNVANHVVEAGVAAARDLEQTAPDNATGW